jgi:hypothetical protein
VKRAVVVTALLPLLTVCGTAAADTVWLPGPARGIPRTSSASRDTAVFEYAYGPRAQASIGMEPGLIVFGGPEVVTHVGFYALAGLENGTDTRLFPPSELWRGLAGASITWELPRVARAWLLPGSDLELGLVVGHESDHESAGSTARLETPAQSAIPFGAGGDFLAPDVAVSLPWGPLTLTLRLQDRIYWNAFPLMVGARTASDVVADDLHEGLAQAAGADLVVQWHARDWVQPRLAVFAEHLFARDPFVDDGGFFRAMLGAVFPGRVGELEPFGSFDAGNGKGLLVDRRELRLSFGVRYAVF